MNEDPLHICTACKRELRDHDLVVGDYGVVVAGAYVGNDFVVCCDSID